MSEADLFKEIDNALLDLQAATSQSFSRPIKRLGQLIDSDELKDAVEPLVQDLDLEAFLTSQESDGGMLGSEEIDWPVDDRKTLGLTLLLIRKFAASPGELIDFGHTYYYAGNKHTANLHAVVRQLLIPFGRDFKTYVLTRGNPTPKIPPVISEKVFIVHGHDGEARETVARFLSLIGLEPIILHEQASRGRTVIEKVEANSDVGFAVVLLTPDDVGSAKGGALEPRARQNVLLELGYFIAKLGRERVCSLKRGTVEIPSDFAGVVWEAMDIGNGWKQSLARELQAAGYRIDWNKVMR
ncbi:TIR domain-containing protein [Mesorhizobium sp. CA5]|uniref:TIR domain-containing protein n=1 Tax=Mesorhizobium sp. CA5 TaxID=2876638 RepID=UPI001CD0A15E|nr:nucleotide-binding protein [Mesorhizobium sp. CA5]MBZ9844049.1 nucleotide-binding protein [Mesorhizobium sp. CA5]